MTGGYIICPQTLSDKIVSEIVAKFRLHNETTGVLNGYKDLCDLMFNAMNIGKPIFMSGEVDIEYDMDSYYNVKYSIVTSVSTFEKYPSITLLLDSRIVLVSASDPSTGRLAFKAVTQP